MRVAALMSAPVVAVGPDTLVEDLIRILRIRQISALPVVDQDRHLLGLVSEGDLLAIDAARGLRAGVRTAASLMTREVVTVSPADNALTVASLMTRRNLRHVPVLDRGQLVGMLSRRDLIGMLDLSDADIKAAVDAVLEDEFGAARPRVSVSQGRVSVNLDESEPAYWLAKSVVAGVPGVLSFDTRSART